MHGGLKQNCNCKSSYISAKNITVAHFILSIHNKGILFKLYLTIIHYNYFAFLTAGTPCFLYNGIK